jgi:hypothetical protein
MHPHYRMGALLKKQAFDKPFVNPSTGARGVIARSRVALLYRDLQLADAPLLLSSRAAASAPLFVPLSSLLSPPAAAAAAASRRLVLLGGRLGVRFVAFFFALFSPRRFRVDMTQRTRLLRHARATGVEVLETGPCRPGDVVIAWDEAAAKQAVVEGARVAFVGKVGLKRSKVLLVDRT